MSSEFETIFVQDNLNPVIKLEPYDDGQNENGNNRSSAAEESKIGEIFHVRKDHFKFVCAHCFAEFSLLVQFTAHVQHHLHKIYTESVDTELFNDVDSVDVNRLQLDCIADLPIAATTNCDDDSMSPTKRRKLKKSSERPYQSPICKLKYGSQKTLERPMKATHSTSKIEIKTVSDGICEIGSNQGTSANNADASNATVSGELQQHNDDQTIIIKKNRTGDPCQKSICEICNLEFGSKQSVARHKGQKHRPNQRLANKSYECWLCHVPFNRHRELLNHFRVEHRKKLVYRDFRYKLRVCGKCGKEFNDMHLLSKHYIWHQEQLNGRQHKCGVCDKTFVQSCKLKRHMITHSTRDFKCDLCDKSFKSQTAKKGHARVHGTRQGVQCDQCGKVLMNIHKLKSHKLIHTGEKPFVCEYCHKRFRQIHNLTTHKRHHTGKYIHYCTPCKKGFSYRRELRKHNFCVHQIESVEENELK